MTTETPGATAAPSHRASALMVACVVFLFFAWGFSTVLIDTIIPKLKAVFELTYAEAMLTQFAFFAGYFVFSIPAGYLLARQGYMRSIITGLLVMAAGCLLFAPAAASGAYGGFLAALFVMAAGITILQVAANPLIAGLGAESSSHARLTLAQAFNALGTTIGPMFGAALVLTGALAVDVPAGLSGPELAAARAVQSHAVQLPFLAIAAVLVALALLFFFLRNKPTPSVEGTGAHLLGAFSLLGRARLGFGVLCIFLYVGAEVSIGSLMANYLMHVLHVSPLAAGQMVSLYWGGAMLGRFIGAGLMRFVKPGVLLSCNAVVALCLVALSATSQGEIAAYALIAVGLCNSIMFPTIFALALEDLGPRKPEGSALLCMAIVGGALIPVLTGGVADFWGIAASLAIPALCYAAIALYGASTARTKIADVKAGFVAAGH